MSFPSYKFEHVVVFAIIAAAVAFWALSRLTPWDHAVCLSVASLVIGVPLLLYEEFHLRRKQRRSEAFMRDVLGGTDAADGEGKRGP